ncbi:MAG: hypothetical protein DRP02_05780 [Candidatus Gerdarchaeota archaeon]|nr:MAG: hypothetical protein DRP02_05780 [Candidatus Gerdarchaeota archaeon]
MDKEEIIVFIRHNISVPKDLLEKLWDEKKIAIHYENICSTNPNKYKKNFREVKFAFDLMHKMSKEGAIVAADFRRIRKDAILVGKITKGTKIGCLKKNEYKLKTMQLSSFREVSFMDYPIFQSSQPRGTIKEWSKVSKVLRYFYYEKELPLEVKSLSPEQLEIICYEFLKSKEEIEFLLQPIGRRQKDFDIYGLNKENIRICAQVTFAENKKTIINKLQSLQDSISNNDTILFFFAPKETEKFKKNDFPQIRFISIEKVFDYFIKDKSRLEKIKIMLNIS